METLWSVIRMCSGAGWEMSGGQEVTKAGFMAANKMTPTRSEITYVFVIVTCLPSTDLDNDMTGIELPFTHPMTWECL